MQFIVGLTVDDDAILNTKPTVNRIMLLQIVICLTVGSTADFPLKMRSKSNYSTVGFAVGFTVGLYY